MNNIYHKIITGGFALVLAGAVAFTAAPMDAQASAALGISSQIGLSADMDAAETADVENAMNQTVLDAFHLDGYSNLGIVTVSEGKVNIRDSASTEGKIVGKIGNNAGCDVLGEEGEWLQIKSGKVEGYIKAEYVLTGSEALEKAGSLLKTVADVNTEGLKVRTQPSTDSEVLDIVGSDQSFDVLEELDEWVKIDLDGEEGYLFKDYVNVGAKLDEALTISEVMYGAGVSDVRMALSNFAKQYIGNPYVWGGTNLNMGADCSGFVKSVYKSFGYNLPRSSSSQRSAGRKVSYSNKQPGDLICYSGHIAIYIGNGKIVHASSRKTGIKISPKANYRKVLSVRRIVK